MEWHFGRVCWPDIRKMDLMVTEIQGVHDALPGNEFAATTGIMMCICEDPQITTIVSLVLLSYDREPGFDLADTSEERMRRQAKSP